MYGGCLSVNAGAWSVSASGNSSIGSLYVDNMRMNVSSNRLEDCGAFMSKNTFSLDTIFYGVKAYGGGISVAVGAYSFSDSREGSSVVSGDTTVSSSSYTISSNTLNNCTASTSTSGSSSSSSSSSS